MSCLTPWEKKDNAAGVSYMLPCGKCPKCVARRISGWSFRLMMEDRHSTCAHFITLTYDAPFVHITPNGFMNLDKRDVQLFMKKLRLANAEKLKYYAVGEYGGKSFRPHYHLIIFNVDISTIQPAWSKGHIHYGTVTAASVGYSLKYMSKPNRIPQHKRDDRQKEFSLFSKGLGSKYLSAAILKWHKSDVDNRMYLTIEDGKKIAMPRYFKDKIYDENERSQAATAAIRKIGQQIVEFNSRPDYDLAFANKQKAIVAAFQAQAADAKKIGNNKI